MNDTCDLPDLAHEYGAFEPHVSLYYLSAKGGFFDATQRVVNWDDVAERLDDAQRHAA